MRSVPVIDILLPTRGRAENLHRCLRSAHDTATNPQQIHASIYRDRDDSVWYEPKIQACVGLLGQLNSHVEPRQILARAFNFLAEKSEGDILLCCGDDVIFKTAGWDAVVRAEFEAQPDGVLLVFGDDKINGERLAAHAFVSKRSVNLLGYLYFDAGQWGMVDFWLDSLYAAVGRRKYMPGVVMEHCHPVVRKAVLDDTYREVWARNRQSWAHRHEYEADFRKSVERLRAAILSGETHDGKRNTHHCDAGLRQDRASGVVGPPGAHGPPGAEV